MSRFIPIDKMKKLREAAKTGDERAKKILSTQLGGTEDFSSLMEEYFSAPKVEEQSTGSMPEQKEDAKLEQFLKENGITKESPDYKGFVNDFYKENPEEQESECECCLMIKKLLKEELDAIDSYSRAITQTMASEEIEDGEKRKIISRLEEIKSDEVEHHSELTRLLSICKKKE